ncbi:CSEP0425 putative effector protein [Blumeria hordei DH14]|uniref:CSEP0425 putative effector protein n=1 Tax=Blumeria graminis f. sp. hordei (strain DH14) TaxID=546991 RepID=N1JGJ4_BLUG1|nr:CSEP0425 putative effector protein [Blumeria hordei DH14]
MKFFATLSLSLLLTSTPTIARSVNGSSLQTVDRRSSGPRHFGFECGSKKYKLSTCIDVVKDACEANPIVRKPGSIVPNSTMAKHPMEFIRAKEFGYPNDTMIVELPLSLFGQFPAHIMQIFDAKTNYFRNNKPELRCIYASGL